MTQEVLKLALEALENNRQTHHYCEDTWYSCPKHEDGCANESEGDECNCGADKANAEIDKAITAIKEALAQHDSVQAKPEPEQEPVITDWERIARVQNAKLMAICNEAGGFEKLCEVMDKYEQTTPPQRTWVGLNTDEMKEIADRYHLKPPNVPVAFRTIEAKLKQKNGYAEEKNT